VTLERPGSGRSSDPCCTPLGCTARRLGPPTADALLSARGLAIAYDGKDAIRDVDLDLRERRVTALIGPSGCGKTSVLLALNRLSALVPGCAVRGSLRFDGREIDAASDAGPLRRDVGMVFQRPNPFPLSIRSNLLLPLREHGCPRPELDGRVENALRRVGLWDETKDRLDRPALTLSGGQQQRLCIARALTLRPRMLLMDEPCSALDPLSTEVIERLLAELRRELGIVIVTHNLAQARRVADDVTVFWCDSGIGCVVESGTAEQVFTAPRASETRDYVAGACG